MPKIKIFREDYYQDLEKDVNDFIKNKRVINVSYTMAGCGYSYTYSCCVLYE